MAQTVQIRSDQVEHPTMPLRALLLRFASVAILATTSALDNEEMRAVAKGRLADRIVRSLHREIKVEKALHANITERTAALKVEIHLLRTRLAEYDAKAKSDLLESPAVLGARACELVSSTRPDAFQHGHRQVSYNLAAQTQLCNETRMHDTSRLIFMTISYRRPGRLEKVIHRSTCFLTQETQVNLSSTVCHCACAALPVVLFPAAPRWERPMDCRG